MKKQHSEKAKTIWSWIGKLLFAAFWLAILAVLFLNRDKFRVDLLLERLPEKRWIAVPVILALFACKSMLMFLYCGILYTVSGILLPLPLALLVNLLGSAIMATLPYLLGRWKGKGLVSKLTAKFPKLSLLQKFNERDDFYLPFLVRMTGLLPGDPASLMMGAIGLPYGEYLLGSVAGLLPLILIFSTMGVGIQNDAAVAFFVSVGAKLLMTVLSLLIFRHWKKGRETA